MRKPLLFKRVRYSKKLAKKCSAALKSVMFMNDFDNFNKKCRAGVPKLSPSVCPFSISIDERVPLNMAAERIFSRKGPIVDFLGAGQKYFAGAAKSGKITFSPLETRKTTFYAKIDGKMSNLKVMVRPCLPLLKPMPPKLLMIKRLRKIAKIYLPISMQ